MALKAILEKLDDVAEAFRGEYKEHTVGDKKVYLLDVTPTEGFELDDVRSLKTALGKERTDRTRLEREVVKFKDIDPERARDALAKLAEFENIDPSKEADKIANTKFEAAKAQLLKKHQEELEGEKSKSTKYRSKIEKLLVDSVAVGAIAAEKGSTELLLPHVQRQTRVVEDGDDFKVEIIGPDGNVRIGNSKGEPMTIKDLIAEMKASTEFGRAFDGEGTSGSGKRPGNNGGGNPTLKRSQMSAAQKAEYQKEHGQTAFLKLPLK